MSYYVSLRVRGIIKKELREVFEPIALRGEWASSMDPVLRDYGEENRSARSVPMYDAMGPDSWQPAWPTMYDSATGAWQFQCAYNCMSFDSLAWEDDIVPYVFESISHYEVFFEGWEGQEGTHLYLLDGKLHCRKEPKTDG